MGYIIDTDICIDFLKGQSFAVELFKDVLDNEDYFISILTHYELLKGAYNKKQESAVKRFIDLVDTIGITENIIKTGAELYKKYRKKGITLSDIDCLIMATAKEHNLKIVTRNVKHYPQRELLSDFSLKLIN